MTAAPDQISLVLPNGLKVVLVQRPFGKGFTACLNFRAGSQDDPAGAVGVAHLTEHLAFTGETRDLSRKLTEQSVYVNASTEQQRTAYYVSGHNDYFGAGLRLLASILDACEIDSEACLHEREIVYQELYDDQPNTLSERTTAHSQLHYRLAGDPNWRLDYQRRMRSVRKLTSDAVNAFRREFYRADQAAVAIVAPCDLNEMSHMIEDFFGPIACRERLEVSKDNPGDWQATPTLTFQFDWWPNTWVSMTNTLADSKVITRQAADIVAHHLGGGPHSELFGRFRQDTAAAYDATTYSACWMHHTCITSFVSLHKKSAVDAVKFLVERGKRFAEEGIDAARLECLLDRDRRWWEMRMESHYQLANFLSFEALRPEASSMLDHRPDTTPFQETIGEQLNEVARRLFDSQNRKLFIGGRIGWIGRHRIRRLLGDA